MPVTGEDLRAAMRRFPSGVAVVTALDGDRPVGLTVGSLVSQSLEPPLVGIAVGEHSILRQPLRERRRFAASLLAGDQTAEAQHFARNVPPIAAWTGVETRTAPFEEPLLAGALAWLECAVVGEHPAGDHSLFLAEVLSVELGRPGPALVYVEGGYRPA